MEAAGDMRTAALPLVVLASGLQYLRFAKKPMAKPLHFVTDRCSRRAVYVGFFAELCSVRLLPLSMAYPMNASFLVFLYFWRESKRPRSSLMRLTISAVSVLCVWALPFLDDSTAALPRASEAVDSAASSTTCILAAAFFVLGFASQKLSGLRWLNGSVLAMCCPAAASFGLSALLIKALVSAASVLLESPQRIELWVALPLMVGALLGLRALAVTPIRRAMEAHDTLSVLASYSLASSVAATIAGTCVYGEQSQWKFTRQVVFAGAICAHCAGLHALASSGADKGANARKNESKDDLAPGSRPMSPGRDGTSGGRRSQRDDGVKGKQNVEMARLGVGTSIGSRAAGRDGGGETNGETPSDSAPLLNFERERRSVDEDAQFEEKLFAHALSLAPERLAGLAGGDGALGLPEVDSDIIVGGFASPGMKATPQFDADFEEIMRRFDEDDRSGEETGPGVVPVLGDLHSPSSASPATAEQQKMYMESVLQFDAQVLLDAPVDDDEDLLLKSLEDVPEL